MDNLNNLIAPDIAGIKQVLDRHPIILMAVLFGSLAKGEASRDSDLDLAIGADRPLEEHEKMQLIAELAEALGRPVDLVDIFSVGEPLLGQIVTRGKRILGDDARFAVMLSKHLFNQADFVPYQSRILTERRQAWIGQ
ncbi:MAG: DNA polymerase III subunit beta [Gammaproteobacteria bacterium HGW-Gammaproteobacteria-3]|nr:MAG: DNA polymerase III subunit beta [Gammaproteobacteria bacterium HGW-Gammaproteobacteria-3]